MPSADYLRLGVNIDHVATVRNARGGSHPDPVRAALMAQAAGADGITAHLREDRRHIRDADMQRLRHEVQLPLNFEMGATAEMLKIALAIRPHAVCLVPERREEITTEGGLDVRGNLGRLKPFVRDLTAAGIRVSMFIEADAAQIAACAELGAPVIELHTGAYCHAEGAQRALELNKLRRAAGEATRLGIECHAGHGLAFDTVGPVAAIMDIKELNIGHFLIGEAIFAGLDAAIRTMRQHMDAARKPRG
jgi:pyridoxine 5-phosphate synthase